MDDLRKIDDFWIRFVSVFSLFCQHFRASTTQNDLRATLAPRVLSSFNTPTTSELHTRNSILLIMPACQLVKIQLVTCGNHWVLEYRTIELSQNLMNKLIQSVSSLVATAFPTQTRRQTFPCRPRNIKHNVITNSHNT